MNEIYFGTYCLTGMVILLVDCDHVIRKLGPAAALVITLWPIWLAYRILRYVYGAL